MHFVLDGDESIRSRPMGRVAEPLLAMGASVETAEAGRPPLRIDGRRLQAIHYEMPVASAQVKSCLLLAGLLAEGRTTVREPAATRDHTERMLRAAGAAVRVERERPSLPTDPVAATIGIEPAERIALPPMTVPGDLSSAAFHLVAGLIVPGADVRDRPASASTRRGSGCSGSSTGWEPTLEVGRAGSRGRRAGRLDPRPRRRPPGGAGRSRRGRDCDRRAAAGRPARLLRRGDDEGRAARPSCATRSRTGSPAVVDALNALGGRGGGLRRTGSRSPGPAACAAARWTPGAIIGWRCSGPWPGWRLARGSRSATSAPPGSATRASRAISGRCSAERPGHFAAS